MARAAVWSAVGVALVGCVAVSAGAQEQPVAEAVVAGLEAPRATEQTFLENVSVQTISPTITLNCTGWSGCQPDRTVHLSNNGHGFWVSEPGQNGTLFRVLNSWSLNPFAYLKSPLSVGPSTTLSPHPQSALSVYGDGNGRLTVEDYGSQVVGRNLLRMINNGPATFRFENRASGASWGFGTIVAEDKFFVSKSGAASLDLTLDGAGNLVILGALTQLSDRNAKRDVQELDGRELLRKLADLPLSSWSYKADGQAVRHVGPMAQDFSAAFGLGHDDRHVAPSDVAGVSLAAAQALQHELEARLAEKDAQIAALAERLAALERALPPPTDRAVQ